MPILHEVATMTAKGQITVPKPIRQALGVDTGTKVMFELLDNGEVIVSRVDAEHEDAALRGFLALIDRDIEAGRNIEDLPEDLARKMRADARLDIDLDESIEGDVDL